MLITFYFFLLSFNREDAFQKEENTFNDIRFEEASILYNLAVIYSKLGNNEARRTHEVRSDKTNINDDILVHFRIC